MTSLRIGKHRIVKNIASLRKVNIAHPYVLLEASGSNPFKLKSQNSLAEGSVHGVHCLLGNHKRAFPCRSNPINCLPSTCSESVEPDGEECVLSRCSTGNLSALKGAACLRRWHTGSREDLLVETSTFP